MSYKCSHCKTSKLFNNPALMEFAYCTTCQCPRSFSPSTISTTAVRLPSSFSSVPRFVGSTGSLPMRSNHSNSGNFSGNRERPSRPTTNLGRSSSMATIQPCDYFKLCLEYMLTLNFSPRLFNRKQNRCYCENCYSPTSKDFYMEGGARYVIPRGWVRFGLFVDDAQAAVEDIWHKWIVSYHGTSPYAAKSIIEHHLFLLPGDKCIDGTVIAIREGHIPGKFQVYTSPTIAYSGHDIYCSAASFRSTSTGKTYQAKIVLQCRQQPGTFKIQAETINAGNKRICPVVPNSEVEYFTEVRSSIIPYGLLIRVFE